MQISKDWLWLCSMNIGGEETIETFNKEIGNIKIKTELENTKKNQSEIKNIITQIQNTLHKINSREDEAENQISDLEDKETEQAQSDKHILRSLCDNFEHSNTHVMGMPKEDKREQEIENLFEMYPHQNT